MELLLELATVLGRVAEVAMPLLAVIVTVGWVAIQVVDWYLGPSETRPSHMGMEYWP